jgi:hypothetical protein
MAFVAAMPHPNSAMLKTTFLCRCCNRTWAYILSPALAEQYQTELQPKQAEREVVWV